MPINEFIIYLAIMAVSTYLIRVIPFVAVKNKLKNRTLKSFFTYIPYAVLTAMTIPAVLYATSNMISAAAGLLVAVILALFKRGLLTVAVAASISVYLVELLFL